MSSTSLTLQSLIERLRDNHPDVVAFRIKRDGDYVEFTRGEVAQRAAVLGAHLASLGVQPGDRVGLLSDNQPEWGMAYLSIVGHGMTAVPIDRLLKPGEYQRILVDSGARAIIVSGGFIEDVRKIKDSLPNLEHILHLEDTVHQEQNGVAPDYVADPDDLAVLIYTSGTTGQPKGVMLSHKNIMTNVVSCTQSISFSRGDNFLSVLPMHHTFECTAGFLAPIYEGAAVTYVGSLKSRDIIDTMRDTQATIMLAVPLLYEKMHAGILRKIKTQPPHLKTILNLSMSVVKVAEKFNKKIGRAVFRSLREKGGFGSIRFFISGAAALPPEVAQGFERLGMVILQGYGLTEASPVVSVNRFDSPKHDSVGRLISGVEVKVLNPDETGVGELMVRGDNVMLGYYKNTEATAEVLKDGWLYTGDSGWVDEDGHIHIAGRLKNVIVTKAGKNIYPEEIEGELLLSPYIAEVLVFGAVKASSGEEYVKAIVVPDYEYLEQENMDTDEAFLTALLDQEIRERCANLADYKRVKEFELRKEEFPKTSTRKIKRFLLQQQTQ
ncbi:MAG TPA: long-chain fatty acid--CoA ligase [candidate division Zixibacteria bacterium]|nr:long-chain fatty acid--CoA ligase [candidate division Zixibacteria bacterium]